MTKATKRTIGVICLLWLGTLLLLFANYKTKVYLEQLRSQVDAVTQQEQANATAVKRQPSRTKTVPRIFWQGIRCWLVTTGTKDSQKSKTATPERWLTFTEVLLCRH